MQFLEIGDPRTAALAGGLSATLHDENTLGVFVETARDDLDKSVNLTVSQGDYVQLAIIHAKRIEPTAQSANDRRHRPL